MARLNEIKKYSSKSDTNIHILLAVHREITMKNLQVDESQLQLTKLKERLKQYLLKENFVKNKQLLSMMFENTVWRLDTKRNIFVGMDLLQQNLTCLLMHFYVVVSELPGQKTILEPFKNIALNPDLMITAYFPTMPQDDTDELFGVIKDSDRNLQAYTCPNGHIYFIGECGNPWTKGKCNECGAEIGGQYHTSSDKNVLHDNKDRTNQGHCLGIALPTQLLPERHLSRLAVATIRLLLHFSMFIGANVNCKAIHQSIKNADIGLNDVPAFLIEHVILDLESIHTLLGKSNDDIRTIIHALLAYVVKDNEVSSAETPLSDEMCVLGNKKARQEWERQFSGKYITPMLNDLETTLQKNNDRINKDDRKGTSIRLLSEAPIELEKIDIRRFHEIPVVWRYRERITINHVAQKLTVSKQNCPVLQLFLTEEHHLRALQYIPNIIKLHKLLAQRYNRKIEKANKLTIRDVKNDFIKDGKLEIFENRLKDYSDAWECVRQALEKFECQANKTRVKVDPMYCRQSIDENTSISFLLPTHRGMGLCSYVLLYFLLEKQNKFLQDYCTIKQIKYNSLPKVHVRDISQGHLISYDPDRDLLPMVLANCNYSFEVGKDTTIEYNFFDLERQLMDRFLFSKSQIINVIEIETFTYRAEFKNAMLFEELTKRIKQERLNTSVRMKIGTEISTKEYPAMCESLDKLDIAISFLTSVGSDQDMTVSEFMTGTLKISNPFVSQKAEQVCRCKHIMSLWMTLSIERTKCQAAHQQDTFDGISDSFKVALTSKQTQELRLILESLNLDQISLLLEQIFELIVLKLDVAQGTGDDYFDTSLYSFQDIFFQYIETPLYEDDLIIDDGLKHAIQMLPSSGDDVIVAGQAVEIWNLTNEVFATKLQKRTSA